MERVGTKKGQIDRIMLVIVTVILVFGILVFVSAALSVLPKSGELFQRMIISQLLFALAGGAGAAFLVSKIPFKMLQKYALPLGIFSLVLTALVFIPGVGFEHGGARRWISLGFTTIQPAEVLKFGVVLYWAAFLSFVGNSIKKWNFGLIALGLFVLIPGALLLFQPDTGTFLVLFGVLVLMYFMAGAPFKHILVMAGVAIMFLAVLVLGRPYLLDRIKTFGDPARDPTGSSYQIKQSLIAVGSGGFWGRGYGRSAQKFEYLPEPVGDSVFAVASEELGFIGSFMMILLFMAFLWRGLFISNRAPNQFSRLLVAGIVLMVTLQAFVNVASILGLMPLTGLPLSFVSHGGSSLLITLSMVGIVFQVSRHQKRVRYTSNKAGGIIKG